MSTSGESGVSAGSEDARLDRMRDRHRLSKSCLRLGRRLPWASWGVARRKWLSEQRFAFAAQQQTFDTYLHALDLVDRRIEALERSRGRLRRIGHVMPKVATQSQRPLSLSSLRVSPSDAPASEMHGGHIHVRSR
jgi:hypothetical protein